MSTRCRIGLKLKDGRVQSIYCHHDGYIPEGVGQTLHEFYRDLDKIEELMECCDITSLGETIQETFNMSYNKTNNEHTNWLIDKTVDEYWKNHPDVDYKYLYDDGIWYVKRDSCPVVLDSDLISIHGI